MKNQTIVLDFFIALSAMAALISTYGCGSFLNTATPTATQTQAPTTTRTSTSTKTPAPTLTPSVTMTPPPIKVDFDDICKNSGKTIITSGTIYAPYSIFEWTVEGELRYSLNFEKERWGGSLIHLLIRAVADPGPNEMALIPGGNWSKGELKIHTSDNTIIRPRVFPELESPLWIQAYVVPDSGNGGGCLLILEELWLP